MRKLGIIMPVRNQENFVGETVRCMVEAVQYARDVAECTLLLIDDDSTDLSVERILSGVQDKVKVEMFSTRGVGPAWARNQALAKWESFDFFAFLDSDDRWEVTHLYESVTALESIGCDLVYSDVTGIDESGRPVNIFGVANPKWFSMEEIERANYVYISTVVMRSKCASADRMSKWAEPFPDWEYWHRLAKKYHVHHLDAHVGAKYMWKTRTGPWTYYDAERAAQANAKIVEWREFNWPHRVDGWLSQEEMDFLREATRGKRVLELGAYKGKSTCVMAMDAESVHSVDTFESTTDGQTQSGATLTLDAFLVNTSRFGNVTHSVGRTDAVLLDMSASMRSDELYEFCFIDAMHDHDSVLSDLELSHALVRGKIALHDYFNPDYPGVASAVQKFMSDRGIALEVERHGSIGVISKFRRAEYGHALLELSNDLKNKTVNDISDLDAEKPAGGRQNSIVIAPFATRLPDGRQNPKSPPVSYWLQVTKRLKELGFTLIHVGTENEPDIGADLRVSRPPMRALKSLLMESAFFVSVDTFLQHYANYIGCTGVVVWSQSDPKIFGYEDNVNLYKPQCVRANQFHLWTQTVYMEEAFVPPSEVVNACVRMPRLNTKTKAEI